MSCGNKFVSLKMYREIQMSWLCHNWIRRNDWLRGENSICRNQHSNAAQPREKTMQKSEKKYRCYSLSMSHCRNYCDYGTQPCSGIGVENAYIIWFETQYNRASCPLSFASLDLMFSFWTKLGFHNATKVQSRYDNTDAHITALVACHRISQRLKHIKNVVPLFIFP